MKIKPRTYYKRYYDKDNYDILYTDNELVYVIAEKYKDLPTYKLDKIVSYFTIKAWQRNIEHNTVNVEEIGKADLFLELL